MPLKQRNQTKPKTNGNYIKNWWTYPKYKGRLTEVVRKQTNPPYKANVVKNKMWGVYEN